MALRTATWLDVARQRRDGFAGQVLLLTTSSAIGQVLLLAATPVLARMYAPEHFGVFAIFSAIALTLTVVASLRFETAIPLPAEDATAVRVLVLALVSSAALSLALALLVLAVFVSPWFEWDAGHGWLLALLPAGALIGGWYQGLSYWATRTSAFGTVARSKLVQGSGTVAGQGGLGVVSATAGSLLAGDLVGRAAAVASLGAGAWPAILRERPGISARALLGTAAAFRRFPLVAAPAALVNTATLYVGAPVFAALYGAETAGFFGLGARLIIAPAALLSAGIAPVFLSRAARLANDDPAAFHRFFRRTLVQLCLPGGVLALAGLSGAPLLLPLLLGDSWEGAVPFAQCLAVTAAVSLVGSPLSQVVFVAGKQTGQLVGDVVRFALVLSAVVVAHEVAPANATLGAVTYAAVMVGTYVAMLAFYDRVARGVAGNRPAEA